WNLLGGGEDVLLMEKLLETYRGFGSLNSLVDVGGGKGSSLSMIVMKYPSIMGINFDMPYVIGQASPHHDKTNIFSLPTYCIEQVGGNLFGRVPEGDAILLSLGYKNSSSKPYHPNVFNLLK
ncbi:O-methyltransferase domain, partial [Dillenia turbinata]